MAEPRTDPLAHEIAKVVDAGNCSGCGGCALISGRVSMQLSDDGFLRPSVIARSDRDLDTAASAEATRFRRICPGVSVPGAPRTARHHRIFGRYESVWQGFASDEAQRRHGSSAGVLTALSGWLVAEGHAESVVEAAADPSNVRRTIPVRATSAAEAVRYTGSRYAPVAALTAWTEESSAALVGKPCEVSAARALWATRRGAAAKAPVMLSFFCAGTPSQRATDSLAASLLPGPVEPLTELAYRGDGWPGRFRVRDSTGREGSASYEDSWGTHLGRDLQWRCKICVDGTGADADISVGDFWDADENGYPRFVEQDGNSVVIARTPRGHELLLAAARAGVIHLAPANLDDVERIQPLQRDRRRTLNGRLAGRKLAGYRVPRYPRQGLAALTLRYPVQSLKSLVGTFLRSRGLRR